MKKLLISSALLSSLLAAGMVSAQTSPATGTAPAGEASTQNRAGEGNPTQRPDGTMPSSRGEVKSEARSQNRMPNNTNTPAGEASIVRNNQPNPAPRNMSDTTRSEVRQQARQNRTKPRRGELGEKTPNVPTNPPVGGTPQ